MSLAAVFVFLVVFGLQLVDRYLHLARKVSADILEPCSRHLSRTLLGSSVNSDPSDE
jgi:hypothetical protein